MEIEAKHRQARTDFHEALLHDLLALGKEIVHVQKQKAKVQQNILELLKPPLVDAAEPPANVPPHLAA